MSLENLFYHLHLTMFSNKELFLSSGLNSADYFTINLFVLIDVNQKC